jgi:hypothetical protein
VETSASVLCAFVLQLMTIASVPPPAMVSVKLWSRDSPPRFPRPSPFSQDSLAASAAPHG